MVTLRRFYWLVFILLFFAPFVQAQNGIRISPYAGGNIPTSGFKDFSTTGLNLGFSVDYQLSKNFAVGLGLNNRTNSFSMPFDYSGIPGNMLSSLNKGGKWNSTLIGIGPTYTIGTSRFLMDIYGKAGFAINNTPEISQAFEIGTNSYNLFSIKKQRSTDFGLSSGLRFHYLISDAISLFLNPQYFYTPAKAEYAYRNTEEAMRGENINVDILMQQPTIQKKITLNSFNINAGITFHLNKSKNAAKEDYSEPGLGNQVISMESEKTNQGCRAVTLSYPLDQQDIYLDQKVRPTFKWTETSRDKPMDYIFKLQDQRGNTIFSKRTKRTEMSISKDMEAVLRRYANKEGTKLLWNVASRFKDCGTITSRSNTTVLYSRSVGLIADFRDVQCEPNAYDGTGNVHYTGEVYFENPASNNTTINIPIQTFYTTTTGNTNSINVTPSPTVTSIITLTPGQNATTYFNFYRPFGETQTALHVKYYQDGNSALTVEEIPLADLPNCICKICDKWKIIPSSIRMNKHSGTTANARAVTDFKIENADPIQRVKANIISIKQYVNDTLCLTCTKQSKTMGLFESGFIKNGLGWQDNGHATLFDENNDSYGNELTWTATSAQGVDFSSNKTFIMDLNLPPFNKLKCCEVVYEICIRFTFTDINCKTCDYEVCYKISSKSKPVGNDDGGILIDMKKLPR